MICPNEYGGSGPGRTCVRVYGLVPAISAPEQVESTVIEAQQASVRNSKRDGSEREIGNSKWGRRHRTEVQNGGIGRVAQAVSEFSDVSGGNAGRIRNS